MSTPHGHLVVLRKLSLSSGAVPGSLGGARGGLGVSVARSGICRGRVKLAVRAKR